MLTCEVSKHFLDVIRNYFKWNGAIAVKIC